MDGAPASRVLIVSNGHGEDVVGARIGTQLLARGPGVQVQAFPLVGIGRAYLAAGMSVEGPTRELPSGGLTVHSLSNFLADVRAGFMSLTGRQLVHLASRRADALVTVGDIYAQALSSLVRSPRRFVVQTLVSARHWQDGNASSPNRLFMERITLPERLLMKYRADKVFVRDVETERALKALGVTNALFAGNPIADGLTGTVPSELQGKRTVLLLPGTRSYTPAALARMLKAIELLPSGPSFALAWALDLPPAVPEGWSWQPSLGSDRGSVGSLSRGDLRVLVYRNRFADLLNAAKVILGTAGTAHEQAVALGRPVVSFPLPPHYSTAFLQNQQRLLGPALRIAAGDERSIATTLSGLLNDPARADQAGRQGQSRLGRPGGSAAVAQAVIESLVAGFDPASDSTAGAVR